MEQYIARAESLKAVVREQRPLLRKPKSPRLLGMYVCMHVCVYVCMHILNSTIHAFLTTSCERVNMFYDHV